MFHRDVLAFFLTWLSSRVLIFGAQDTTSSALSRILHLLSVNPEVQSKLRDEIEFALKNRRHEDSDGRLDYDTLMALPWLDAVLKETLRLRVLILFSPTLSTLLIYIQQIPSGTFRTTNVGFLNSMT
jgi:cytochrome P450